MKKEIAKVLRQLEHLHHHEIQCAMGDKGCVKKAKAKAKAAKAKKKTKSAQYEEVDSAFPRHKTLRKRHRTRDVIPLSADLSASAYIRKLKRDARRKKQLRAAE